MRKYYNVVDNQLKSSTKGDIFTPLCLQALYGNKKTFKSMENSVCVRVCVREKDDDYKKTKKAFFFVLQ